MSSHSHGNDDARRMSEFCNSYDHCDWDTDRRFQLLLATLITGSESDTSSTVTSTSSSSGVSVAAVIGIAIASFMVGIIVSWGVMIAGGFLKKRPQEKRTANGTIDSEGVSEEEGN